MTPKINIFIFCLPINIADKKYYNFAHSISLAFKTPYLHKLSQYNLIPTLQRTNAWSLSQLWPTFWRFTYILPKQVLSQALSQIPSKGMARSKWLKTSNNNNSNAEDVK